MLLVGERHLSLACGACHEVLHLSPLTIVCLATLFDNTPTRHALNQPYAITSQDMVHKPHLQVNT